MTGEGPVNFAIVWTSCLVVLWNLGKSMPGMAGGFSPVRLAVFGLAFPAVLFALYRRLIRN